MWGLDLSQSMDGAGGIGGLLAVVDESGSQMAFLYDANGNVGQLVDEAGSVVARYEYDAFGQTLVAAGAAANENAYRFSTKYADQETGLVYYGGRYYLPSIGRWTQRDRIAERGGANLFGFIGNNTPNLFDTLGQAPGGTPPYWPPVEPTDPASPVPPSPVLPSPAPPSPAPAPVNGEGYVIPGSPKSGHKDAGHMANFPRATRSEMGFYSDDGQWHPMSDLGPDSSIGPGSHLSRSDAWRRYGRINQMGPGHNPNSVWPENTNWIVDFEVPRGLLEDPDYNWKWIPPGFSYNQKRVDAKGRVLGFKINADMAPMLAQALKNVALNGQACFLKTYNDGWNVGIGRLDRGKKGPSAHAYGLAIDINAGPNAQGNVNFQMGSNLVQSFTSAGLYWGGWFSDGSVDAMHFSLGW